MNTCVIVTVIICLTSLLIVFIIWHNKKVQNILEADKGYKEYDKNQNLLREGLVRNIWDLGYFPALSRIYFPADWKIILAFILLVSLFVFYWIVRDNSVLDLIKVNVGAIMGTLIGNGKTPNQKSNEPGNL